jgi:hypothetical protein
VTAPTSWPPPTSPPPPERASPATPTSPVSSPGPDSVPLDLGRSTRTPSPAQRRRSPPATGGARSRAATDHRVGPRAITSSTGPATGPPISRTSACSAVTTTTPSTTGLLRHPETRRHPPLHPTRRHRAHLSRRSRPAGSHPAQRRRPPSLVTARFG